MAQVRLNTAIQAARHHPGWTALGVACLGVLIGLALAGTNQATSSYWNQVHALSRQADAAKNLDTPAEAIAALIDIEAKLASLDTAGVDARALDSVNRLRTVLVRARGCVEEGQRMLDHPVRTMAKGAVDTLLGREVLRDLREQVTHLRTVMIEAHEFSVDAHRRLSRRYPLSHFERPIPPDFAMMDEALNELERIDRENKDMRDKVKHAYEIGLVLGGIARAMFGG